MFSPTNNVVPPQPGTSIPYICTKCGEHFTAKKKGWFSFEAFAIKCPKCGSRKCFSPVRW